MHKHSVFSDIDTFCFSELVRNTSDLPLAVGMIFTNSMLITDELVDFLNPSIN